MFQNKYAHNSLVSTDVRRLYHMLFDIRQFFTKLHNLFLYLGFQPQGRVQLDGDLPLRLDTSDTLRAVAVLQR